MNLILTRYSYAATETEGKLEFRDTRLWTMEQPWVDHIDGVPAASGAPFKSCIPEGEYTMQPFTRPNGENTWVLTNYRLGVFAHKSDTHGEGQRFLCLFHKGNFVSDVEGCILPGLARAILDTERAVTSSAAAMNKLRDELGELSEGHTLTIVQERGALYGGE